MTNRPSLAGERDILAALTPRPGTRSLVDIQEKVNHILGTESDVMTRASLHPMLRPRIETEALLVF